MNEQPFWLDANSLLSKWGFGDGDAFDDWWWDTYDSEPPANSDDILHALVVEYLMPKIRAAGHTGELMRIGTNHNPIRLETLDGVEVDWYDGNGELQVSVPVTREQVEALRSRITIPPQ